MAVETMNALVINRVWRGTSFSLKDMSAMWTVKEMKNTQLSVTSDTEESTDAVGSPIMIFNRAKRAQLTASAAMFSLDLAAAQAGGEKNIASTTATIDAPWSDYLQVKTVDTLTLTHIPAGSFPAPFAYRLNPDGSLGEKFAKDTTAGTGKFSLVGAVMTFAEGAVAVGDRFYVPYSYIADGSANNGAVEVVNDAINFPKVSFFRMEVFVNDPCDQDTEYYAYVEMPSAKLSSDFDFTFATDTEHPFTIDANQDYCDPLRKLFRIVVPELGIAA